MKNRYGHKLRSFISASYHVEHYIDMVGTDAFHSEVTAYPAIITIAKRRGSHTLIAKRPPIKPKTLTALAKRLNNPTEKASPRARVAIEVIPNAINNGDPWLLDAALQLRLIRRLEEDYPPLEAHGCKVGIGVASGKDSVFIAPYEQLDVEVDRKLPLAVAKDLATGLLCWGGLGILNPFDEQGRLVALANYPKLASYLKRHEADLRKRHVARKNPTSWYRTIDRIHLDLVKQPKLLIPDIKDKPTVVYDAGTVYPHHNLYWITSDTWPLRALQSVLRSTIARLFVWAYSVKMRGGFLRYQAQNLRRIRLPVWAEIPADMQRRLIQGAEAPATVINALVFELYDLNQGDQGVISTLFHGV
jgi:hypothetical protein